MLRSRDQRAAQLRSRAMSITVIAVTVAAFGAILSSRAEGAGNAGRGGGLAATLQNAGIGPKSN